MKIVNTEIKDKKLIMTVEVDNKEWKKVIDKEVQKASKDVKVDGFRAGKAPKSEILKRINMPQVLYFAANDMANVTLKDVVESKEFDNSKIDAYPTPSLEIEKLSEEELVLKYIFVEFPKAEVGDYKKMKINIISPKVTDEEVDAEIDRLLSKEKMYAKKGGKIENGDLAIFDFKGFIDGKEFPGGTAEKYELEIGSKMFIPGFEEQMLGIGEGEEKELKLSFPKDYHARDFAGKDVTFKVKVHEIKSVTKPKLDDEFVKNLKFGEVDTVAKLKDYIKTNMFKFKTQNANEQNIMEVNRGLIEITKIDEIPEIIIDDEARKIKNQLNQRLKQMQMKLEDYAKMTGKTLEDFDQEIKQQAKNNIIVYAALEVISEKEKITIDDKALEEKYAELSKYYHSSIEDVKKSIDKDLLSELLLNELTIQKIISYYISK